MRQYETEHYMFHFHPGSPAQRDILAIAAGQESCFAQITAFLGVRPKTRLQYFLCDSPEEVGHFYGDDDPCNGFARLPDRIYAVYNDQVQCVGFHEDAHMVSYTINRPASAAVREGLAMFFDGCWWGIANRDWAVHYLHSGQYVPVAKLLENDTFFALDCALTYPIVGAFTEFLLRQYGKERYLEFYRCTEDARAALARVYGKTAEALDEEFTEYLRRCPLDPAAVARIEEKIAVQP